MQTGSRSRVERIVNGQVPNANFGELDEIGKLTGDQAHVAGDFNDQPTQEG